MVIAQRKKCPNCPKSFVPIQKTQRFCCENCRKEFHKYGGAFAKLKVELEKVVKRRLREINPGDPETIGSILKRLDALETKMSALQNVFGGKG